MMERMSMFVSPPPKTKRNVTKRASHGTQFSAICHDTWPAGVTFEDKPQCVEREAERVSCCQISMLEKHEAGH
jgi:hypothetical protein